MHLLGHGVDIVEVDRICRSIVDHGDRFLERVFTEGERAYCDGKKRRFEHLAGRFAAKEAVLKAVGTGWRDGIAWTDAEVVLEASGAPTIVLHGQLASIAQRQGITQWRLSISHTEHYAVASAIALGAG